MPHGFTAGGFRLILHDNLQEELCHKDQRRVHRRGRTDRQEGGECRRLFWCECGVLFLQVCAFAFAHIGWRESRGGKWGGFSWSSQKTSGLFFYHFVHSSFYVWVHHPVVPHETQLTDCCNHQRDHRLKSCRRLVWCPQGLLTSLYLLQSFIELRKLLLQPEGTDREAMEKLSLVGSQIIEEHRAIDLLYSYHTLPLLLIVLIYVYSCVQGVLTQELRWNKLDGLQHVWF